MQSMRFVWAALINPGLLFVGMRFYLSQLAPKFPLSEWKPNKKNPCLIADNKVFAFPVLVVSGYSLLGNAVLSPNSHPAILLLLLNDTEPSEVTCLHNFPDNGDPSLVEMEKAVRALVLFQPLPSALTSLLADFGIVPLPPSFKYPSAVCLSLCVFCLRVLRVHSMRLCLK